MDLKTEREKRWTEIRRAKQKAGERKMDRKMAHVERVIALESIENADRIEVAKILGWQCIVKKGEFKVGDLVCFFEIDSLLDKDNSVFEFMAKHKFRVRTMKLRGVLSQGLALPISILPQPGIYEEGQDISDILKVTKYEVPIPAQLAGQIKGRRPGYVPKTDEVRVQSEPKLIDEFRGKKVYISVKIDGSSGSFSRLDNEYDVCSRNLSIKEDDGKNAFWQVYKKYNLKEVLDSAGNFVVQGEIAGMGIQKNRLGLKEIDLFVFNVWDIGNAKYLDCEDFLAFCEKYKLQTVPIVCKDVEFTWDLNELLEMAQGKYEPSGHEREGIVIRPMIEAHSDVLAGRLSMKVVNNKYLLEGGE